MVNEFYYTMAFYYRGLIGNCGPHVLKLCNAQTHTEVLRPLVADLQTSRMGFLIGEKSNITTQTISDEEMEEERIETTISINGTFPVGLPFVFCSPLGRVNESVLKEVLGSFEKDVVGWYSFRRNSTHSASLRETLLHRELCKVLRIDHPQYFLFCIITTAANDRNATHSHRFSFSTSNYRRFQPVSVLETNLGEPEDNVYRRSTVIDESFKHLQEVLRSLNGVNSSKMAMTTLHTQVNKHVEALECNISKLQAEVDGRLLRIGSSNFNCAAKHWGSAGQPIDSNQNVPDKNKEYQENQEEQQPKKDNSNSEMEGKTRSGRIPKKPKSFEDYFCQ